MPTLSFTHLSATDFEEFSSDLLHALDFVNIDWRKGTPRPSSPSDSGRDIVAEEIRKDVDGSTHLDKWFIDCKHYKKGVPPTELQSLLAWAEAECPDVALFVVSGFLSNPAKDYLENYKRNRRPSFKIKYWELPKLERLTSRKIALLRKYDLTEVPIRSIQAILKAETEFYDKRWYDRHKMGVRSHQSGHKVMRPEVLKSAKASAKRLEKKYGKKNMGPYTDFEWGMLAGKHSAIRWVLGERWDMLDT